MFEYTAEEVAHYKTGVCADNLTRSLALEIVFLKERVKALENKGLPEGISVSEHQP